MEGGGRPKLNTVNVIVHAFKQNGVHQCESQLRVISTHLYSARVW
jgi:hypothetical protein